MAYRTKAILCMLAALFICNNSMLFAAEKAPAQKAVDPAEGIEIKVTEDKNLGDGIAFLKENDYEKAAFSFEKFLITCPDAIDQMILVGGITAGAIRHPLERGVAYFKEKINKNSDNYSSYYLIGIMQIMGAESAKEAPIFINAAIERGLEVNKGHYMLGVYYLLKHEKKLYLGEIDYLQSLDIDLANRLKQLNENSRFFKMFDDIQKNSSINPNE